MCQAVLTGECFQDLASRIPGNVSHARWLTMANRILCLYISSFDVTPQLKKLAEFALKIYTPSQLYDKCYPSIIYAPQNFLKIVQYLQIFRNPVAEFSVSICCTSKFIFSSDDGVPRLLITENTSLKKYLVQKQGDVNIISV